MSIFGCKRCAELERDLAEAAQYAKAMSEAFDRHLKRMCEFDDAPKDLYERARYSSRRGCASSVIRRPHYLRGRRER